MKRLFIVPVVLIGFAFFGTACKKQHTCTCNAKYAGVAGESEEFWGETLIEGKKKDAQVACDAMQGDPQMIFTEVYVLECQLTK